MNIELTTVYPVVSGANFGEWLRLLCHRGGYDLSTQAAGNLMSYAVSRAGVKVAEIETLPVGERLKVRTVRIGFESDGPRAIPGFIGLYGAGLSSDFGVTLETGIDSGIMAWALDGMYSGVTGLPPMPEDAVTSPAPGGASHNPQSAQTSAAGQSFTFDADCNDVLDHFAGKPTGERLTRVRTYDHVEGDDVYHVRVSAVDIENALAGLACIITLEAPEGRERMHVAQITLAQERRGECRAELTLLPDRVGPYHDLDRRYMRQAAWPTAQWLAWGMWKRAIADWLVRKPTDAPTNSRPVKQGKPGRKPDALYMRAFEMIAEGTPKNEARAWFYKEAGIIAPDEKSNNAFDQAMRRYKKRITK